MRYDSLLYGQEFPKPTLCIRFNPHSNLEDSCTLSFLDKIKILLQRSKDWLNSPLPNEEFLQTMSVQYLFYPRESKHKSTARRSVYTLKVLPDIDKLPDEMVFDPDVDNLCMDVILNAANEKRSSRLLESYIEYSSSAINQSQCEALSRVGTKDEHRCSQTKAKGSTLCSRHKNSTKTIKRWNDE